MTTPTIDSARRMAAKLSCLAALALLVALVTAGPASAAFGIASFDTTLTDASGTSTQAGAHADFMTHFMLNTAPSQSGEELPEAQAKDVEIDMPAGFYGDPEQISRCSKAEFGSTLGIGCAPATQIGISEVFPTSNPADAFPAPLFNLDPEAGEVATFGFSFSGVPIKIGMTVRSTPDGYRLRARLRDVNQGIALYGARVTIWGVPGDPSHDAWRAGPYGAPIRPFLTAPPDCDGPVQTNVRVRSWADPGTWAEASSVLPPRTGCDLLDFEPAISAAPVSRQADTPSGYSVKLAVQQNQALQSFGTPHLRRAVVGLPEGVSISPSSANGLKACTDAEMAAGADVEPACPAASKIGTATIDTPVLPAPLTGDIVVGEPRPGNLFRIWIVARAEGVLLKLPGTVMPDPATGQLTTTFENTPQLPFTELTLRFKDGPRAPLANPRTCGTKTTTAEFLSWAGDARSSDSRFDVVGCGGGFSPAFEAGSVTPFAGAFSPFTMTVRRADGQPDLRDISVDMPQGLLGMVGRVPKCADAAAAAGTCGEESRIGTTTVEAGPGSNPFPLTGKVFLAGPYKGAPYSLSIVVRAIAGPYDLGTVVVRAPIHVDPRTADLSIPSDPLPTILEGVPLRLRTVNVTIDRDRFTVNPTDCRPSAVAGIVGSTAGQAVGVSTPFQVGDCAALPFEPRLGLRLTGRRQTVTGRHPGLRASVVQGGLGDAGIDRAVVRLPRSLALDPDNARALCEFEDGTKPDLERHCPAGSIVGRARVTTPLLSRPLAGNVYFVKNVRVDRRTGSRIRTLPMLVVALRGEIAINLRGTSDVSRGRLVSSFAGVPDAPIGRFDLRLNGGASGILVVTDSARGPLSLCRGRQTASVQMRGQNGKRAGYPVRIKTACARKARKGQR